MGRKSCHENRKGRPAHISSADNCFLRPDLYPTCSKRLWQDHDSFFHSGAAYRDVSEPPMQRVPDDSCYLLRPEHRRQQTRTYKNGCPPDNNHLPHHDTYHLRLYLDIC